MHSDRMVTDITAFCFVSRPLWGRFFRCCTAGVPKARAILPPSDLRRLASALWDYPFTDITAHKDRCYAGQLALDLVNLAFQLGDDHRNALLEVAKPIVEKCPVDHRRESLWLLYQRSGDITRLRAWVRRWLADDGWLWADDAGSREIIADDLLPLARQLGEDNLADKAEERLRWLQITYRGHKEYTFDTPIAWFRELAQKEPTSWRDLGVKLWVLSEACSALGGDNECAWELGEVLGAAAWGCGPTDVWQLLTTEYKACGTEVLVSSDRKPPHRRSVTTTPLATALAVARPSIWLVPRSWSQSLVQ